MDLRKLSNLDNSECGYLASVHPLSLEVYLTGSSCYDAYIDHDEDLETTHHDDWNGAIVEHRVEWWNCQNSCFNCCQHKWTLSIMVDWIRRSQLIGIETMDYETGTPYGSIDEVWVNPLGRVSHLTTDQQACIPINQVSHITHNPVLTHTLSLMSQPNDLYRLHHISVLTSPSQAPFGWVEDFLFDWTTGDITAYVICGNNAAHLDRRIMLFPDEVELMADEFMLLKADVNNRHQEWIETSRLPVVHMPR